MRFSSKEQSDYLQMTRVMLDNFQLTPTIKEKLSVLGYDDNRMQEGAALLADSQALFRLYLEKRQGKLAGYKTLLESYRSSSKEYRASVKRLRKEFKNDPQSTAELSLQGIRDRTRSGYTEQAVTFYNKALNNPDILIKVQRLGYSPEKLADGLRSVESYQTSIRDYGKAQGECQRLVEDRDKAFKRLHDWTSAFIASCRYAFEDSPQALEEIGIFMRNQSKPRKKETDPVTPPAPVIEPDTHPIPIPETGKDVVTMM